MKVIKSLKDKAVADLLKQGAIAVIPTDTVYGVVARAEDEGAVEKLYALKKREHKPGTVIAASVDQLVQLGILPRYLKAVEQFWPGAISVIVPSSLSLKYLDQGTFSLAVRIPDPQDLRDLLKQTGPLLTSSANNPGETPAGTIQEAEKYFGDNVDFYVDGGDLSGHEPSTVIRMIDDAIDIVRKGAVKIDENGRILA
jgi:L-threonylcarbamoyladenylate synthase